MTYIPNNTVIVKHDKGDVPKKEPVTIEEAKSGLGVVVEEAENRLKNIVDTVDSRIVSVESLVSKFKVDIANSKKEIEKVEGLHQEVGQFNSQVGECNKKVDDHQRTTKETLQQESNNIAAKLADADTKILDIEKKMKEAEEKLQEERDKNANLILSSHKKNEQILDAKLSFVKHEVRENLSNFSKTLDSIPHKVENIIKRGKTFRVLLIVSQVIFDIGVLAYLFIN